MAKNSITDYDNLSSNNSDVQSVDISEGCSPSGINNAIREVMADLADVNDGTVALTSPKFDSIKDGNIKPPDASGTDVAGTATTIKGGAGTGTGAGGSIVFQTADGGSTGSSVNAHATAMTITDDGKVGIGTTSPDEELHVSGDIIASGFLRVASTQNGGIFDQNGNNGLTVGSNSGSPANTIVAYTNGSERMRLDSSGRMIIGTTGTFYTDAVLQIKQNNTASGNNGCIALQNQNASGGSGVRTIIFLNNVGTYIGSVSNTSSSTSYNTSSDYRLKENDVDMTGAITRVKQLQPKRFNFIADADDTTVDGFMAHEVQTVVPEAITGTHNEVDDEGNPVYQGIDQSKLVPLLTGALQEAIAKIETLEAKVTALENA